VAVPLGPLLALRRSPQLGWDGAAGRRTAHVGTNRPPLETGAQIRGHRPPPSLAHPELHPYCLITPPQERLWASRPNYRSTRSATKHQQAGGGRSGSEASRSKRPPDGSPHRNLETAKRVTDGVSGG
jgi:hypothetical protein